MFLVSLSCLDCDDTSDETEGDYCWQGNWDIGDNDVEEKAEY